jgi:hypothetical protein
MKFRIFLFSVALLLICSAGLALYGVKHHQKWGKPGVRVSQGSLTLDDGKTVTADIVELPLSVFGYQSQAETLGRADIESLPSDTTFGRRRYRASDGFETVLGVVLMGSDRTSLHPPRYCIEGQGCSIQQIEQVSIPIERPVHYDLPVSKVLINKQVEQNGRKFVVSGVYLFWYVSEESVRAEYKTSLWTMLNSLLRGQTMDRWAYVSCFTLCRPGEESQTFARMKQFVASSVPELQLVQTKASTVVSKQ